MMPILNAELAKVNKIDNINHGSNPAPYKVLHHINENWHLKNGTNKTHKTSTNSSISFSSSASTNSTSTVINNSQNVFVQSFDLNSKLTAAKPPCENLISSSNKLSENFSYNEFNNNYYSKCNKELMHEEEENFEKTDNEENAEYFYDENYEPNEYDEKDVISLNVDFSSDCNLLDNVDKVSNLSDNLDEKLDEAPKPCSIYNDGMYKCEINPKKYTLELSELSSESLTSSKSTLPGSDANEKFSSSSSSISYYDDFYVSSKMKRDKNKLKYQAPCSSRLNMSKNLTYVSSNFDKNLLKSNSTLKRYSLYANELDNNFTSEKKRSSQIIEHFSDSSSSLSLLVDSSSSSSLCSKPKINPISSRRKCSKKNENLERSKSNIVKNRPNSDKAIFKGEHFKCEQIKRENTNFQNPSEKLFEKKSKLVNLKHQNNSIHPVQLNNHLNQPLYTQHQPNFVSYENYLSISRKNQRDLIKEQQKHQKTLELNQRTMTAMKQHEYLNAINKNQRTHNTNRSLYMARIHLLDEYLLVKIFSKLNTLEKLNLQFVCKKWHQIIWSNQNTYRLFNRIEIVDKNFKLNPFYPFGQTIRGGTLTSNCTTNTLNKTCAGPSTLSRLFCRKPNNKNKIVNEIEQANKVCIMSINTDLVLKFLLLKLLNRQTYPLSLCVESITIKNNNRLTDKGIELIGKLCPELKYLSLRNCTNIKTNSICKLITSCENLKYLDLTGCFNVTNLIFSNETLQRCASSLGDSNKLEEAQTENFTDSSKSKVGIRKRFTLYISNLKQGKNSSTLKDHNNETSYLNYACSVKDLTLNPNSSSVIMPTNYLYLQFVDLSYCPYVNDRCVQNLCKSCPFIKNFYLRKCKLITDISLLHIAKYCLNLRELSLCQCVKLTDNGIRYLGINTSSYKNNDENDYVNSKFKNSIKSIAKSRIKYLSLAKCPQITDNSLIYLSKIGFFSQIKYLNLRGCCQISDKFVKYFTGGGSRSPPKLKFDQENIEKDDSSFSSDIHNYRNHIPFQLKSLDLSKCQITDKALQYICRTLSHKTNSLQRLNLRYCEGITDDGIKLLALHCKHLQHLNVTKCNKITAHALKQIKINCQSCIIQHTHFSFC